MIAEKEALVACDHHCIIRYSMSLPLTKTLVLLPTSLTTNFGDRAPAAPSPLPAGRDLCRHPEGVVAPDITFLRSPGVRVVEGLRVASLPGHYNPMSFDDESKLAATAAAAEGEYTKHSWLPTLLIRISERALVLLAHLVEEWAADRTRAKLALST